MRKVPMKRELLARGIHQAFVQLGVAFPFKEIQTKLANQQKLGVTNTYIKLSHNEQRFLVRINGNLWKPYTRDSEARILRRIGALGIGTSVLSNQLSFQICRDLSHSHQSFEQALGSANDEQKKQLTKYVAKSIVLYQSNYHHADAERDMVSMIKSAIQGAKNKFGTLQKTEYLFFNAVSMAILRSLMTKEDSLASHGDLLPSSIYVPKPGEKDVHIVDWEYGAYAHWATDLALLTWQMDSNVSEQLANIVIHSHLNEGRFNKSTASMEIELNLNRFLYGYLTILWKANETNIDSFEQDIANLYQELAKTVPMIRLSQKLLLLDAVEVKDEDKENSPSENNKQHYS